MNTRIVKAIADKTRLLIFVHIAKGEICACKLPSIVRKTQPAVSQHLKLLLGAGLVEVKRKGTKRIYSISARGKKVISDISSW